MSTQEESTSLEEKHHHNREVVTSGIRFVKWACVIIAILTLGSLLRSQVFQGQIDQISDAVESLEESSSQTKESADHASDASEAALQELRDAITAVQKSREDQPSLTNQAILDALQAIARLEAHICGGPCPETG